MASKLVELREEMAVKAREVQEIFEKHPDLDFSDDEAEDLKKRNSELDEKGIELGKLVELDDAGRKNRERLEMIEGKSGGAATNYPIPGGASGLVDPYTGKAISSKSIGLQFIESEGFKSFNPSTKQSPSVTFKNPMAYETKTTLTETGYAPQAIRTGLVLPTALQRPMIADLLPQGRTEMVSIVYMEETTATNATDATLEAAALPESALAFTERTAAVQWVGTFLPATNQLMEDAPAMSSYIDGRLRLFLQIKEDSELYQGSGVAPHVRGLINATGLQTQAKGADSALHAILKAITKIWTSTFLPANGLVIHPIDWQNIRLLQETTGAFVLENPGSATFFERIWGLPVVQSTVATQGTALVGAYDTCAQMFRRDDLMMAVSDSHSDYFVRRMLAIRVDERFALAIYRGAGFCTVTGL